MFLIICDWRPFISRSVLFFLLLRPPPRSTLFPYTTLFRSSCSPPAAPVVGRSAATGGHRAGAGYFTAAHAVRRAHLRPRSGAGRGSAQRDPPAGGGRSEEHTSELQSRGHLVCRLLLEKKKD